MTEWKVSFAIMSNNTQVDTEMGNDRENDRKLMSAIGLCVKAGKVIFGVPMICDALRRGGKNAPLLVLESSDTSENTHKRIADKTEFYGVRTVRLQCDGATLASALGKTSSLAAVAITDEQMCKMVEKYI